MPLNWLPHFVNYLAASPIISSCIRRDPIITQLYLYLFNHKHCTNFIPCVYISSFCRFLGSNFFTPSNFHAVVLRMISFGCDYCWTIHSSHFDHKVQCSLMSFFLDMLVLQHEIFNVWKVILSSWHSCLIEVHSDHLITSVYKSDFKTMFAVGTIF